MPAAANARTPAETSADTPPAPLRSLVIVLGDQLDLGAAAFDGFDAAEDAVWMAEVADESTHVWSAKQRIAVFLAAMRHFAQALVEAGRPLHYVRLDDPANRGTLAAELEAAVAVLRPRRLVLTAPGDWRVLQALRGVAERAGLALDIREDRHFYCTVRQFAAHAAKRKSVRLEWFYREMRQVHGVLMEGRAPLGGRWNFDTDNRKAFGAKGPGAVPARAVFAPDATTAEVIALVNRRFADHPGSLASFAWPVTRAEALASLRTFVDERLADFGQWQDAMWPGEPWLWHAHLSSSMNSKLLSAHEVVQAAEAAYHEGRAPLASVEGFVRQVLGWREYVRGLYWTRMPEYLELNALDAHEPLPGWYWSGDTDKACLRDVVTQTFEHGYAHHIQRLMVTGLYALLLGVEPRQVHAWYLAVYVDAVEWAELPNTLGMSQYADGGLMGSKPYVASGAYIQRMGRWCAGCRYDPAVREGERACPFTVLYWDFLARHRERLAGNPRMTMQLKNLDRLDAPTQARIAGQARVIRIAEARTVTTAPAPAPAAQAVPAARTRGAPTSTAGAPRA